MILHVLMGQRKENYEGEYAPEALEVMDEYAFDENGVWLMNKKAEYESLDEFDNLVIIRVYVNDLHLNALMRPANRINGEII